MSVAPTKVCTKCHIAYPLDRFGKQASRKDGLNPWCRNCKKIAGALYYSKNKDRLSDQHRKWVAENPERVASYSREHQRRWRAADPEGYRAYMRRYRTPELNRQYARDDYQRNRQRRLEAAKRWRENNKLTVRVLRLAWLDRSRAKVSTLKRNYKARLKGAAGRHTEHDISFLLKMQKGHCAYCRATLAGGWHVDHVYALSKGGGNDRYNLQLLCPRCNLSKKDKDPIVFAQSLGALL